MQYGKLQGNDGEYIYGNDGNPIFVQVDSTTRPLLPTWNKTVTLYHRTVDVDDQRTEWAKHVIHNCFTSKSSTSTIQNMTVETAVRHIVRIPSDIPVIPCNGDLIFYGDASFSIEDIKGQRASDRLHEYDGFTVNVVSNNANKSDYLKHVRVEGV